MGLWQPASFVQRLCFIFGVLPLEYWISICWGCVPVWSAVSSGWYLVGKDRNASQLYREMVCWSPDEAPFWQHICFSTVNLPSGNQTWHWNIHHLQMIFFPIETSIHRGLTTAIFDYQRVTPVGNPFASFILALSWQSTATSKTT